MLQGQGSEQCTFTLEQLDRSTLDQVFQIAWGVVGTIKRDLSQEDAQTIWQLLEKGGTAEQALTMVRDYKLQVSGRGFHDETRLFGFHLLVNKSKDEMRPGDETINTRFQEGLTKHFRQKTTPS